MRLEEWEREYAEVLETAAAMGWTLAVPPARDAMSNWLTRYDAAVLCVTAFEIALSEHGDSASRGLLTELRDRAVRLRWRASLV